MTPDKISRRLESMKKDRGQLEQTLRECYRYIDPLRGVDLNYGGSINQNTGDGNLSVSNSDKGRIYDNTAKDSVRKLSAAMISGLTPANSRWFDLDVMGEPEFRHAWLDDAADAVWREIHASNYDAIAPEVFQDIIIAGQTGMFIDIQQGLGLTFDQWPLSGMYFSSSRPGGPVDTVVRELTLTAEQVCEMYPDTAGVCHSYEPSKKVDIIEAIYPRKDGKHGAAANNKPIGNLVYMKTGRAILDESGYDEMPVVIPRWALIPRSQYAVGPAYDALPDIKTLNDFVRLKLQSGELAIGGMWGALDDGVLNPATIKIGPRRVVQMSDRDSFFRLDVSSDINVAISEVESLRSQVRMMLLADGLTIPQDPRQTATEINVRMELLRQQIGPVFGRLQSEFLKPLITRVLGLMLRNGLLDPPPDELANAALNVRYVSPLARSQRADEISSMERFEASLMNLSQVDPSVLDVYDMVDAQREKSWLLGVGQRFIRSKEDTDKMAQDRAEAQKAQQEEALQQEAALKQAAPQQ